jgi:hypothetical protein
VNLLVTNVPCCIVSNAETLRLQHPQFLYMGASGGSPDRTRVSHHGTDELLTQKHATPDGEVVSPIWEQTQPLSRFLSNLIDMFLPGRSFIEGHPRITHGIDPLEWLPEESNRSGFGDAPPGLNEEHC